MKRLFLQIIVSVLIIALFVPQGTFAKRSNDPLVEQWGYRDTGVYDAWDKATGTHDVVVAVIDDGFDSYHPDLQQNTWRNTREIADNGIDDDHNGYIDDVWGWNFAVEDANENGVFEPEERAGNNDPRPSVFSLADETDIENAAIHHGTLVAGIIGAVGNNTMNGAGINWQVRLMNVKVIGNTGTGVLLGLPRAIRYAVDNGAHVINMSLVGSVDEEVKAAVKYAYDNGVAVIAAVGNDLVSLNDVPRYPVCADAGEIEEWVIGVSAITEAHRIAPFSNVGSDCVDIAAPGVKVSSTMRYSPRYGLMEQYRGNWQGTSFAAPFVSGAAALVKSIHPEWKAPEIYRALLMTTHKTPPRNEDEYAQLFGAGLLQVNKAVDYALSIPRPRVSDRVLRSVLAVQVSAGSAVYRNYTVDPVLPPVTLSSLQGNTDMALYTENNKNYAVTIKPASRGRVTVTILNDLWIPIRSWTFAGQGNWQVIAGDVTGDGVAEIVAAPGGAESVVARVFATDGKELRVITASERHSGIRALSFVPLITGVGNDLVVVRLSGSRSILERMSSTGAIVESFTLTDLHDVMSVAVGDVDADMSYEYAVLSRDGTVLLSVFEPGGELVRQFTAYDTPAIRSATLITADYNNDGYDDFVISPSAGNQPVRAWSHRVRLLDEWWPFGAGNTGGVKLLPIYRTAGK